MTFRQSTLLISILIFILLFLPHDQLIDRLSYINLFTASPDVLTSSFKDINLLTSQYLWNFLLTSLNIAGLNPSVFFVLLAIFNFTVCSRYIFRNSSFSMLSILTILSFSLLQTTFIHLRQGLALSTFILLAPQPWKNSYTRLLVVAFLCLSIHSFYILPLSIVLVGLFVYRQFYSLRSIFLVTPFSLLLLKPLVTIVFPSLDRYLDNTVSASGFAFLIFGSLLLIITFSKSYNPVFRYLSQLILITYLSAYFVIPGSSRILEGLYPYLAVGIASILQIQYRRLAISLLLLQLIIVLTTRFSSPFLGLTIL